MSLTFTQVSARLVSALLIALMAFTFTLPPKVQAETAGQRSTRNIILAGVALATAIILYNNYHHKQVAHNTVVGHTADGGTIYADGRIVYPDGTVVYTSNNGRTPCTYDGYGVPCGPYAQAYRVANGYGPGEQPVYYRDADDQPAYYRDADDQQTYYRDADDQRVYYRDVDQQRVIYRTVEDEPGYYRASRPVYRYRQNAYRQAFYGSGDREGARGRFAVHENRGHHYGSTKHRNQDGG